MNLQRRRILIALPFIPAAGGTIATGSDAAGSDAAVCRLLDLCEDRHAAARLGGAFLERQPSTPEATMSGLLNRMGIDRAGLGMLSDRRLRQRVSDTIRRDFSAGRTATVRGWILSRTELDLCALHCLQNGAS